MGGELFALKKEINFGLASTRGKNGARSSLSPTYKNAGELSFAQYLVDLTTSSRAPPGTRVADFQGTSISLTIRDRRDDASMPRTGAGRAPSSPFGAMDTPPSSAARRLTSCFSRYRQGDVGHVH